MKTRDNFLDNPEAVREHALNSEYIDWKGYDGEVYKRICITEVPGLTEKIEKVMGPVHMLGQGYRLNYFGEMPNQLIHTDMGWGSHALVLYLNKPKDCGGGTAFWGHKPTHTYGVEANDFDTLKSIGDDWEHQDKWELVDFASMAFNRAVFYKSSAYHSRYPFQAFGTTPEDGRLIAVAFFTPKR